MLLVLLVSVSLVPCVLSQGSQDLSRGISQLGFTLSHKIEKSMDANFVLSPFSAHNALSQILLGSQQNTKAQLENFLGITSNDLSNYGTLQSSLKQGNSTLKIANLLAMATGFKPKSTYIQAIKSRFNSQLKELDFAGNAAASVKEVNDFAAAATDNKISSILSEDKVDALTRIILLNAVYFKALWKTAFDSTESRDGDFFKTPSTPVQTTFMNTKLKVRMQKVGNYQLLELPYQDPTKALIVILPEAGFDTTNIMEAMKDVDFNAIRSESAFDTMVTLPRFTVEKKVDLKDLLVSLGVSDMFSGKANLKGISEEPLQVDEISQKAFIEVTEEGTEAAAVTIAAIGLRTAMRTRKFIANRPFGFVIYDFQEKVPLFMGKVVSPTSSSTTTRTAQSGQSRDQESTTVRADAVVPSGSCARYLTDYANAAENAKLCTEAETKKLFDWLRSFRDTCERSRSLVANFQKNSCASAWCENFKLKIGELRRTNTSKCTGSLRDANLTLCRQTLNHIRVYEAFNCL